MKRFLLAILLPALAAEADELLLQGGAKLHGEVVSETDTEITLRMSRGTLTIPRSRVVEIRRESSADYLRREIAARRKAGDHARAIELLDALLATCPNDAKAQREKAETLFLLAEAERAACRFGEARAALDRLEAEPAALPGVPDLRARIDREEREAAALHDGAMEAIARGDLEGGLRLLQEWRLRRPAGDAAAREALARGHAIFATRAAEAGDLRSALDHFRASALIFPLPAVEEALRLLAPIAVLEALAVGDERGADRLLEPIRSTYPDPAVPIFLRGVLRQQKGETALAVEDYAEAARMAEGRAPPRAGVPYDVVKALAAAILRGTMARPPAESARQWRATFVEPLECVETSWFLVHAPTRAEAGQAAEALDEAFSRISRDLLGGIPAARKVEVVIHPDRQVFMAADPVPPGSGAGGVLLSREEVAGVTWSTRDEEGDALLRIESYAGAAGLLREILPHEVAHVVQRLGLQAFRRAHWLDEGIATTFESPAGRQRRREEFRASSQRIPLAEFLAMESTPPGRGGLFYDQAHAFTEFLMEIGGAEGWRRFLTEFAEHDFEDALRRALGVESLDDLERRWISRDAR